MYKLMKTCLYNFKNNSQIIKPKSLIQLKLLQIQRKGKEILKRSLTKMDSLLRQKLTQLTSKCDILQKNGKYNQCIDIMQEIVSIKKNVYGLDHIQFEKASEKLCQYLNLAAMVHLQKQNFQLTLDDLRKAQIVAGNSLALKSTTYNNLACYYRRTGKVRTALSYLIQALELQLKLQHPKTLADTHLNLCAVLSQLDRHQDALQHSMLSIILLQDQFLQTLLPKMKQKQQDDINDERLAVLAIAYHNLGVEFQHLKRFDQALKIYKKALKFSKDNLSQNEQLVKNLTRVVNSATQQIQQQKKSFLEHKPKTKEQIDPKKDLYKDLSRKIDRFKNLPRIKLNSKQSTLLHQVPPAYHSIDYGNRAKNDLSDQYNVNPNKTLKQSQKRYFAQKFSSKYNNVITPQSRGQLDSQLKFRAGMVTAGNNSMNTTMNNTFLNQQKQRERQRQKQILIKNQQ